MPRVDAQVCILDGRLYSELEPGQHWSAALDDCILVTR
jgi:hypothetical protein